jgi:hypothetical protein
MVFIPVTLASAAAGVVFYLAGDDQVQLFLPRPIYCAMAFVGTLVPLALLGLIITVCLFIRRKFTSADRDAAPGARPDGRD